MAAWARNLFWASIVDVLLTIAGVVLIWRTLVHTKTAAVAANAAVDVAKSANEVMKAQINAYMKIDSAEFDVRQFYGTGPIQIEVFLKATNSGGSPAKAFRWKVRAFCEYQGANPKIRGDDDLPAEIWGIDVAAAETVEQTNNTTPLILNDGDVAAAQQNPFPIFFEIEITYGSIFGNDFRNKSVFQGIVYSGFSGRSRQPLRRIPATFDEVLKRQI